MTNADRRIILSCFANGFEFRKGMEQAKMAEVKTLDGVEIFTVDYMNRLAEMLCNALEKQVPKKPVKGELYFECANCGETRIDYRYFPLSRPKLTYCASCGQAILWTISACGEKGIDQAACDYAERLQEILNKAEDE